VTRVVSRLRDLVPYRPLTSSEAMRVAELQAHHLLRLLDVSAPPVPEGAIAGLPRIQVVRSTKAIPISGSAQWAKGIWHVILNGTEAPARQRFSLAHEFKHILDNPFVHVLYPPTLGLSPHDRAEQTCDYFAACLLMPKVWVRRAWATDRVQDVARLARRFGVSQTAMRVRLVQLGLVEAAPRYRGPEWPQLRNRRRPGTYYRMVSGCGVAERSTNAKGSRQS
jgi:IrrE N-terminal-like domain